jgi:hypothetical protein
VLVGFGRLVATVTRHANPDGPWALVRWKSSKFSYRVIEPTARFATEEQAIAAAAILTDDEKWTVVRTDRTAEGRILDDERPAIVDDDDDDLDDDDDIDDDAPPKRNGESLGQPESHPWRGNGVSAATRADAEFFSDLRSQIPPTMITGSGMLAAAAEADRQQLVQI